MRLSSVALAKEESMNLIGGIFSAIPAQPVVHDEGTALHSSPLSAGFHCIA
jgi:hypothetical protein